LSLLNIPLRKEFITTGIAATEALTGMRARLEKYHYLPAKEKNIQVILDVAHNPDAFKFLKEYFQGRGVKPIVVAGFSKDKDVTAIFHEISQFASQFIAVAADSHRAYPSGELAELAKRSGIASIVS